MKKTILFIGILLNCASLLWSQNMVSTIYRDSVHLVLNANELHFEILLDGSRVKLPVSQTSIFMTEVPNYLPGYIEIENEKKVVSDYDDENRGIEDAFVFRYEADVESDRVLKDNYVVIRWERGDGSKYLATLDMENLDIGKKSQIRYRLYVPVRYRLIEPTVHYVSMGMEVGTSNNIEKPLTPYEQALQASGEKSLPDGNVSPIQVIPNSPIKDEEGNPREGHVHLTMLIDRNGYVTQIGVREYSKWIFAKASLMNAPYFTFKPKIVDGQPVQTGLIVPFKF